MYYATSGKLKQDVPFPVNKITVDTSVLWTFIGQTLSEPPTRMLNYKLNCKTQYAAVGWLLFAILTEGRLSIYLYFIFIKSYSSTIVDSIVKIVLTPPTSWPNSGETPELTHLTPVTLIPLSLPRTSRYLSFKIPLSVISLTPTYYEEVPLVTISSEYLKTLSNTTINSDLRIGGGSYTKKSDELRTSSKKDKAIRLYVNWHSSRKNPIRYHPPSHLLHLLFKIKTQPIQCF